MAMILLTSDDTESHTERIKRLMFAGDVRY
jgi:hypothetical protein